MDDSPRIILFNDLVMHRRRTGVGHYVAHLLRHMPENDPELRVIPLTRTLAGRPLKWASKNLGAQQVSGAPSETSLLSRVKGFVKAAGHAWLDRYFRSLGRWARFHVYHEPDVLPRPLDGPTIATVYDLSVILYPEWHPPHRVKQYERRLEDSLARTDHFLAISSATKSDMVERLGIPAARITVAPAGPRSIFRRLDASVVEATKWRLDLPDGYFLYLGTIEPRKNVTGLLRAYASLPAETRRRAPLILVGGWGWNSDDARAMLDQSPWREEVRWLDYLSDDELVAVVNGARALVYPSFYEGFGMPTVEAMNCGVPVISTAAGGLAEAVGDAALVVPPGDDDALAQAMKALVDSPDLAAELSRRGERQGQRFDWSTTARVTLDAYRKVA